MESTSLVPSLVDVPARLSPAQKRDILGQAVAAVITTALIAAPLLSPPSGSAVSSETTLPAQSFAGAVTAVPAEATISRALPQRPRVSRTRVRAEGTLMASAVPAMVMQPAAGYTTAIDMVPEAPVARKPLSRKLTNWLTGDGTLSVRPFPTVAVRQ